jgi:predicted ATPase
VEDLQWADADTLAAVEYLIDHAAPASLLVVVTLRPEDGGPAAALASAAAARRSAELIELGRLDPAAVAAMASQCLGADVLPTGLEEFLERRAEGRPFFVEEMLAGLLDDAMLLAADGAWLLDARATARVPPTYAAWMAERLATAEPAVGPVLQAAAVLGRPSLALFLVGGALIGTGAGLVFKALLRSCTK